MQCPNWWTCELSVIVAPSLRYWVMPPRSRALASLGVRASTPDTQSILRTTTAHTQQRQHVNHISSVYCRACCSAPCKCVIIDVTQNSGWLGGSVVSVAACGPRGREFDAQPPVAQWGVAVLTAKNSNSRHVTVPCRLLRPTAPWWCLRQLSHPSLWGAVNEDQLRLGRLRQVWFIPSMDKRAVVPVKL